MVFRQGPQLFLKIHFQRNLSTLKHGFCTKGLQQKQKAQTKKKSPWFFRTFFFLFGSTYLRRCTCARVFLLPPRHWINSSWCVICWAAPKKPAGSEEGAFPGELVISKIASLEGSKGFQVVRLKSDFENLVMDFILRVANSNSNLTIISFN